MQYGYRLKMLNNSKIVRSDSTYHIVFFNERGLVKELHFIEEGCWIDIMNIPASLHISEIPYYENTIYCLQEKDK